MKLTVDFSTTYPTYYPYMVFVCSFKQKIKWDKLGLVGLEQKKHAPQFVKLIRIISHSKRQQFSISREKTSEKVEQYFLRSLVCVLILFLTHSLSYSLSPLGNLQRLTKTNINENYLEKLIACKRDIFPTNQVLFRFIHFFFFIMQHDVVSS